MIKLRKLEEKDIPYMIEWMSDEELTKYLKNNFSKLANAEIQKEFIRNSISDRDINFAIVDNSNDEYLGTISLKNIEKDFKSAEYAICIRKGVQGKGVAFQATLKILKYAFFDLKLENVYLYVLKENVRANKFYEKFGFKFDRVENKSLEIKGVMSDINWYSIDKNNFVQIWKNNEKEMINVKKVKYAPITDNRGDLIALENPKNLKFPLNRVYYMYNVGSDIVRGSHSHYNLDQLLIATSGSVVVLAKTPFEEQEYILDNPSEGLYIGNMIWREMYNFSNDAVLMVLASEKYNEDDYIRDYEDYEKEAKRYFKKILKK
ncbi:MAG: GNAT family N-acetyltransferase [Bacilli bacterium]|nr:GNAT family N-acetyltransferase [Bacilli bacterium]